MSGSRCRSTPSSGCMRPSVAAVQTGFHLVGQLALGWSVGRFTDNLMIGLLCHCDAYEQCGFYINLCVCVLMSFIIFVCVCAYECSSVCMLMKCSVCVCMCYSVCVYYLWQSSLVCFVTSFIYSLILLFECLHSFCNMHWYNVDDNIYVT